jgi:hypothetical protein
MTGFRTAGPLGSVLTPHIDEGTMVRGLSLPPVPLGIRELIEETVRRKLRSGVVVVVEVGVDLARRVAIEELRRLGNNLERQLEYLAGLPEALRREVAYQFFASFFDDPLPRKMLWNYVYGRGAPMELTEAEMIGCNPYINLARSRKFRDQLGEAAKAPGSTVQLDMPILAGALTNGTLGGFTVKIKGTLTAGPGAAWRVSGTMSFKDTYDFDPRDFTTGGRTWQGEIKTRVGATLIPGTPYEVTSVSTAFTQTQADPTVVWVGGKPKASLDRIAGMDQKISETDE